MDNRPPCAGRTALFEPFRLPDESDDARSQRLEAAKSVCSRCPLLDKAECLIKAKQSPDLTRGVWGGTVISEITKREGKVDVRLRK